MNQIPKSFRRGTHRAVHPDDTVANALRFAPVMGITRVANVTGLDVVGIPVVMVCRPNSRSLSVSQGKGLELGAARASGLMESIESYHAENIVLPLRLCSYEQLRYIENVVDPWQLPAIVTSPFRPELRILWIQGRDLIQDAPILVPHELVHTDFTWPSPPGSGCFPCTSNGLASGNNILEAISHAICEIVERDATSRWTLLNEERQADTRLALNTVDDPDCCHVLERLQKAGLEIGVWETTTDVGLASFVCVIASDGRGPSRFETESGGMGCHPNRGIALSRALTEAVQSRLTLITGSRDDMDRAKYHGPAPEIIWRRIRRVGHVRSFKDVPTFEGDTINEDVEWALRRLRATEIEHVVVVDLTKAEFRIPVVRVVIPGLEGTHTVPGYAPGKRANEILMATDG